MPFYQVHHSYPLNNEQKQRLASSITNLHCTTFTTPSFFVHVEFVAHDINEGTYFSGGQRRTAGSNRIFGTVRVSPSRNKSDFDTLAAKIEKAWYDTVGSEGEKVADEQRLLMVMFTPIVAIREGGMTIPEAGHEGEWLKRQLPHIRRMSELGMDDFKDMLTELDERDDLKSLLQDAPGGAPLTT